ncbi:replication initiation protein [Paraburkholderia sp. J12]|uniref:replication initiation protein n=1 Tax=Paraburkholderia sp. J12 TaxID=2805432 RepID=UPI002ABE8DC8|nr:replication initiation protein [Paraburkholderia sp. J12]
MPYADVSAVFRERLPRRPYCANELEYGLTVRSTEKALEFLHIQPNAPSQLSWLVFDVDYPGAALAWERANLPPPSLTVINRYNAHAHLFYGLETPVVTSDAGRRSPLRYAAVVQAAYGDRLKSDPGYVGLIAKNPFHPKWKTVWGNRLYDLGELAEYVDLPKSLPKRAATSGLGRNCDLFDELRSWSYRRVLDHQRSRAGRDEWYDAVLRQAERFNMFPEQRGGPLSFNEVKTIAKSVASWTWKHFDAGIFSDIQASRGHRGGRPATTTRDGRPWETMGISRATYYRQRNTGLSVSTASCGETKAISDTSTLTASNEGTLPSGGDVATTGGQGIKQTRVWGIKGAFNALSTSDEASAHIAP